MSIGNEWVVMRRMHSTSVSEALDTRYSQVISSVAAAAIADEAKWDACQIIISVIVITLFPVPCHLLM